MYSIRFDENIVLMQPAGGELVDAVDGQHGPVIAAAGEFDQFSVDGVGLRGDGDGFASVVSGDADFPPDSIIRKHFVNSLKKFPAAIATPSDSRS
ncbi:hypothetical protein OQJ46_13095 [Microbulbifer thermotolerans]|uniref:hypothetical protein n=1 Tax=Microbulbifer thermotolerans TaxID=252514 RepID=UPI00224B97A5|nr:hypothetical protein [Microbulbifer thermotolerans]MCX2783925.1 hypothetical protein [Microbulbifer thermotolerans]